MEQQPFYRRSANAGAAPGPGLEGPLAPETAEGWRERLAAAFPRAVAEVLGPAADPEALLQASLMEGPGEVAHAEKHEVQNEALARLFAGGTGAGCCVLELGCGRAGLGTAVLERLPEARCVLVDREPRRHKLEHRPESRGRRLLRLRMDIQDFDLAALLGAPLDPTALPGPAELQAAALSVSSTGAAGLGPVERLGELWRAAAELQTPPWPPERVLACAKHLCGAGTDAALRALSGCPPGPALGVCVATCCHHRCDADSYPNLPFLRRLGLCGAPADFAALASRAGWALGGRGDTPRRRAGVMAKRILDLGRVAWLREELGLSDARLVAYVGKDVTPENIAILAGTEAADPA